MTTLSFDAFWTWIQQHPNCVLRIATPEAVLYDEDDLHWYLGSHQSELVVQLIRGKRLVGELAVDPERITYVQGLGEEPEGEFVFEAVYEAPTERLAAYVFVMTHGLEDGQPQEPHDTPVH